MDNAARRTGMTLDEFLAFAQTRPDERWEFSRGEAWLMAGATLAHGIIAGNLFRAVQRALEVSGSQCRAFSENTYVRLGETAFLPDLVVTCSPIILTDTAVKTPVVIGEVLSPATADFNRNLKWRRYREFPTLRHYLLVEQDEPAVEIFSRTDLGWHFRRIDGLSECVALEAIGIELLLRELFAGVFPPAPPA